MGQQEEKDVQMNGVMVRADGAVKALLDNGEFHMHVTREMRERMESVMQEIIDQVRQETLDTADQAIKANGAWGFWPRVKIQIESKYQLNQPKRSPNGH